MFKIIFDSEDKPRHNFFKEWRDALAYGKSQAKPFGIYMRDFRVAAWSPKEGFYSFVAPEFIMQDKPRSKHTYKPTTNRAIQ